VPRIDSDEIRRWSTGDVPQAGRLDYFAAALSDAVSPLMLDSADPLSFRADASFAQLDALRSVTFHPPLEPLQIHQNPSVRRPSPNAALNPIAALNFTLHRFNRVSSQLSGNVKQHISTTRRCQLRSRCGHGGV
jgi:hypothetical protein